MSSPRLFAVLALLPTAACVGDPSEIVVSLAPDVVSSLSGELTVRAIVLADRTPIEGEPLEISVDYADRGGVAHAIAPVSGTTDGTGAFEATLAGMTWDGRGTVLVTGAGIEGTASFAVLDRTPPTVTLTAPVAATVRRGQDITIDVHVTDEIGVSQVWFGSSLRARDRSLIASGTMSASATAMRGASALSVRAFTRP